jgi:protein ImuB
VRGRRRAAPDDAPDELNRAAPLVTVAKTANALRLVALDDRAARAGLFPGMALADARAMLPGLDVVEDDPKADAALLTDIALWCGRYTPLVALNPPHGLFLDIAGCAHLLGGEAGLVGDLLGRLQRAGFAVAAAVAPTPGAAFALSRHGGGFIAEGGILDALAPLPLSALRLNRESVAAAGRLGLKRIGQLAGAPRAPLTARLGESLLTRLDQALGRMPEPISPLAPVPRFSAERRFIEPLALADGIAACLKSLTTHLAAALERRGGGARRLDLVLFGVAGSRVSITVSTSRPLRDAGRMAELLNERLAALAPRADKDTGFDVIRLSAPVTAPLDPVQIGITDGSLGGDGGSEDLARLIDRLGARFGLRRIVRLSPLDSHIPEFAVAAVPAVLEAPRKSAPWPQDASAEDDDAPARPVRLIEPPEPVDAIAEVPDGPPVRFSWRRMSYRVARAEGPERLAPEWWHARGGAHLTRDYYRVEDEDGRRFWLYRAGLYIQETASPRWFIHGIFA